MHQVALDRHGVQIVTRFEAVPPVRAQRMKLGHVLINLLKNAKEAMADLDREQKAVTVEVNSTSEGGAQIRIIDTGAGIAPEDIPKLFRHGFTTKSSGHGFGLHFSATAMEEMGGTLEATSAGPGQGATFTLSFPPRLVVPSPQA
jgi:signal transduction histidine kinase